MPETSRRGEYTLRMKTRPLVSVVIPFYNTGKYLRRCVKSIAGQTYRDLEILLVDDGSEDRSAEDADALARKDSRIRVIRIAHGGVSAARNEGLKESSGTCVLFVDSDDWMDGSIVEQMVEQMDKTDADLVSCDIVFSDGREAGSRKKAAAAEKTDAEESTGPLIEIYSREEYMRFFFKIGSNENVHFPVAKLYKRELLPQAMYPEGIRVGEDVLGTYRALAGVKRIAWIRKSGYFYFKNPESVTTLFSPKDFDLLRVWDQVVENTQGHEPDHTYAKINRDRINFTLLFRMITEVPSDERKRNYSTQTDKLRKDLRRCEKELLQSPIIGSRKVMIVLLNRCYPLMSAAGNMYVRFSQMRGRIPGLTRRKLS